MLWKTRRSRELLTARAFERWKSHLPATATKVNRCSDIRIGPETVNSAAVARRRRANLLGALLRLPLWRRQLSLLAQLGAGSTMPPATSRAMVNEAGPPPQRLISAQSAFQFSACRSRKPQRSATTRDLLDVVHHYPQEPPSRWCANWTRWRAPAAGQASPLQPLAGRARNPIGHSSPPSRPPAPTPWREDGCAASGKRQDSSPLRAAAQPGPFSLAADRFAGDAGPPARGPPAPAPPPRQ